MVPRKVIFAVDTLKILRYPYGCFPDLPNLY